MYMEGMYLNTWNICFSNWYIAIWRNPLTKEWNYVASCGSMYNFPPLEISMVYCIHIYTFIHLHFFMN